MIHFHNDCNGCLYYSPAIHAVCCRHRCHHHHVAMVFLRLGIARILTQVLKKVNGGYDVIIASCSAQSLDTVVTSRELKVPSGHLWFCRCCDNTKGYQTCASKRQYDMCISTKIDLADYLSSKILVSVPL